MDRAHTYFFRHATKLVAYLVEFQILSSQYVKVCICWLKRCLALVMATELSTTLLESILKAQ